MVDRRCCHGITITDGRRSTTSLTSAEVATESEWLENIEHHQSQNYNFSMEMILEIIATVCLIGGGLLLVYKLLNDKRFFSNDSSGGGQKVFRPK